MKYLLILPLLFLLAGCEDPSVYENTEAKIEPRIETSRMRYYIAPYPKDAMLILEQEIGHRVILTESASNYTIFVYKNIGEK